MIFNELDFTMKYTPNGSLDRDLQREALRQQVKLAENLKLPIKISVVGSRFVFILL